MNGRSNMARTKRASKKAPKKTSCGKMTVSVCRSKKKGTFTKKSKKAACGKISVPVCRSPKGTFAKKPVRAKGHAGGTQKPAVNREGLTFIEWLNAAGRPDLKASARDWSSVSQKLVQAWKAGEDPTEYRAKGRASGRLTKRQHIGELMQHWHSSSGDPIYAVGSFYFADQDYPDKKVVRAALASLESDLVDAKKGAYGWGESEAKELTTIIAYLKSELREKGRASGRLTKRQHIGELMQHWHSSSGDPIYAVGSFYFADQDYPDKKVVRAALASLESDLVDAKKGAYGWGESEAKELTTIIAYLKSELREKGHGHASGRASVPRKWFGMDVEPAGRMQLNVLVPRLRDPQGPIPSQRGKPFDGEDLRIMKNRRVALRDELQALANLTGRKVRGVKYTTQGLHVIEVVWPKEKGHAGGRSPQKGKHSKNAAIFVDAAEEILTEIGARLVGRYDINDALFGSRWEVDTGAGKLRVSVSPAVTFMGGHLNTQFADVERAKKLGLAHMNPYSGKWNHLIQTTSKGETKARVREILLSVITARPEKGHAGGSSEHGRVPSVESILKGLPWLRQTSTNPKATAVEARRIMQSMKPSEAMRALDKLLGTHGVESASQDPYATPREWERQESFTFLNTGDTYTPTIILYRGNYMIRSWGDLVESLERRGKRFH